jgi:hypothetical protein
MVSHGKEEATERDVIMGNPRRYAASLHTKIKTWKRFFILRKIPYISSVNQ